MNYVQGQIIQYNHVHQFCLICDLNHARTLIEEKPFYEPYALENGETLYHFNSSIMIPTGFVEIINNNFPQPEYFEANFAPAVDRWIKNFEAMTNKKYNITTLTFKTVSK